MRKFEAIKIRNFSRCLSYLTIFLVCACHPGDGFDRVEKVPSNSPQRLDDSCGLISSFPRDKAYSLDPFYQKYCDADGIPVLGSKDVDIAALLAAQRRAIMMSRKLDKSVLQAMLDANVRIVVIAQNEVTTDIPEYSDLNIVFPNTDWDRRTRGLGATVERPVSSGAEENLLCYANDRYAGEDIFIHEYAHTIHMLGLRRVIPEFEIELSKAYSNAKKNGLWVDTYAGSLAAEYWAEGVQSWFGVNQQAQPGIHNHVNTRAELRDYDLPLYELTAKYMPENYRTSCP